MKQTIKTKKSMAQHATLLLCSAMVVIMSSCDPTGKSWDIRPHSLPTEVVLFCGNPGVGKSALLNSIFQEVAFPSGTNIGGGLTRVKQEYIYENRMYIDTPGLSDISFRQQASKEIEKALKTNNNYKIVFVLTFEGGRIKPDDLATINTVCEAIQTPFEYGLIFNKVTKGVLESCNQNGKAWAAAYLSLLHKQPASCLIIENDEDMEAADNVYLPANAEDRQNLLAFISNLKPNKIAADQVNKPNDVAYAERVQEMTAQVLATQRQLAEVEAKMIEAQAKMTQAISKMSEAEAERNKTEASIRIAEAKAKKAQATTKMWGTAIQVGLGLVPALL